MENTPVRLLRNFCWMFVIACGIAQPTTAMADLIALKLPGITGDVTVAGYQGTIEALSLTGEIERSVTIGSGTGGAGAGRATFGDLMIHKRFDSASPALFLAIVTGKVFSNAVFTFLQGSSGHLKKIPDYALSSAIKAWYKTGTLGLFLRV
jgi:type VI protein secretion system component Hcp